MIATEVEKKPYTRAGQEYVAFHISFHFYDHRLSHITTITKPQFRSYLKKNSPPAAPRDVGEGGVSSSKE
jgi:hypothetical protein